MLETFRWHDRAIVDEGLYERLHEAHRLVADVVAGTLAGAGILAGDLAGTAARIEAGWQAEKENAA